MIQAPSEGGTPRDYDGAVGERAPIGGQDPMRSLWKKRQERSAHMSGGELLLTS
jgi:hypothetical protein